MHPGVSASDLLCLLGNRGRSEPFFAVAVGGGWCGTDKVPLKQDCMAGLLNEDFLLQHLGGQRGPCWLSVTALGKSVLPCQEAEGAAQCCCLLSAVQWAACCVLVWRAC